jgi:hypothetical protein
MHCSDRRLSSWKHLLWRIRVISHKLGIFASGNREVVKGGSLNRICSSESCSISFLETKEKNRKKTKGFLKQMDTKKTKKSPNRTKKSDTCMSYLKRKHRGKQNKKKERRVYKKQNSTFVLSRSTPNKTMKEKENDSMNKVKERNRER